MPSSPQVQHRDHNHLQCDHSLDHRQQQSPRRHSRRRKVEENLCEERDRLPDYSTSCSCEDKKSGREVFERNPSSHLHSHHFSSKSLLSEKEDATALLHPSLGKASSMECNTSSIPLRVKTSTKCSHASRNQSSNEICSLRRQRRRSRGSRTCSSRRISRTNEVWVDGPLFSQQQTELQSSQHHSKNLNDLACQSLDRSQVRSRHLRRHSHHSKKHQVHQNCSGHRVVGKKDGKEIPDGEEVALICQDKQQRIQDWIQQHTKQIWTDILSDNDKNSSGKSNSNSSNRDKESQSSFHNKHLTALSLTMSKNKVLNLPSCNSCKNPCMIVNPSNDANAPQATCSPSSSATTLIDCTSKVVSSSISQKSLEINDESGGNNVNDDQRKDNCVKWRDIQRNCETGSKGADYQLSRRIPRDLTVKEVENVSKNQMIITETTTNEKSYVNSTPVAKNTLQPLHVSSIQTSKVINALSETEDEAEETEVDEEAYFSESCLHDLDRECFHCNNGLHHDNCQRENITVCQRRRRKSRQISGDLVRVMDGCSFMEDDVVSEGTQSEPTIADFPGTLKLEQYLQQLIAVTKAQQEDTQNNSDRQFTSQDCPEVLTTTTPFETTSEITNRHSCQSTASPMIPIYASVNKESKKQCSQQPFVPSSSGNSSSHVTTGNGIIITTVPEVSSPVHSYKSNGKSSSSRNNSSNSLRRNKNTSKLPTVNQTKRNKTSTEEVVVDNSSPVDSVLNVSSPLSDQRPRHPRYSHTSSNEPSSSTTPASGLSDSIPQSSKISSSGYNSHEESDREIPSSRDGRVIEKKSTRETNNKSDGKASSSDKKNRAEQHSVKQDQSINQNRVTSSSVKLRSKSKDVQSTSKSSSSSPKHVVSNSSPHHRHHDPKRDSIASVSENCSLLCCKFFK